MKKNLLKSKVQRFLAEIGVREFRRGFPPLPPVPNAIGMYVNYIWGWLENEKKKYVLEIFEEALSSDIPEGYRRCTCDGILLDSFETKLAYKIKEYTPYNHYGQIINHFVFFHLLLRTERNLEPSWLPCENMRFEFKFT